MGEGARSRVRVPAARGLSERRRAALATGDRLGAPVVAVVGAGVMGCATAWALTERGADVTVFEQFELGHTRGSSHGRSRIFRLAYPQAHWVRLAQEAVAGWRELEREWGRAVLDV